MHLNDAGTPAAGALPFAAGRQDGQPAPDADNLLRLSEAAFHARRATGAPPVTAAELMEEWSRKQAAQATHKDPMHQVRPNPSATEPLGFLAMTDEQHEAMAEIEAAMIKRR